MLNLDVVLVIIGAICLVIAVLPAFQAAGISIPHLPRHTRVVLIVFGLSTFGLGLVLSPQLGLIDDGMPAPTFVPSPTAEPLDTRIAVAAPDDPSDSAQLPDASGPLPVTDTPSPTSTPVPPTTTPTPTLVPSTDTPTPVPPTATLMSLSQPTGKYPCPLIVPRAQVNEWRIGQASIQAVTEAIGQFDSLRPHNEGSFDRSATIPVGVLVATDFDQYDGEKWKQYPVQPIVHSGSWGLFETIGQYEAPNAGACITIGN